jgi:putative ABC transport system permease protein
MTDAPAGQGAAPHAHHRLARVLAAVLLGLGVTSLLAIRGAVHDADATVHRFYDRTNFADYLVQGGNAAQFASGAAKVPGVATVRTRTTATLAVWLGGDQTKVQGTLIGVPAGSPGVDELDVRKGQPIDPNGTGAVVERHSAEDLGIQPGDPLRILGLGDVVDVHVRGVAVSPEYLLPAQSQQQIVSAKGSFVVVYVPQALAAQIAGPAGVSQVLVRYDPDADTAATDARLHRLARASGAALAYTPTNQPSNAILDEERAGFDDAGIIVPALFLLTGAVVVALVAGQTTRVRAAGTSRRWRLRAIAGPVAVGVLWGLVAGSVGARLLVTLITDDLSLTNPVRDTPFGAAGLAIAAALAAGAVAYAIAALPARKHVTSLGPGGVAAVGLATALALVAVIAPIGVIDSARATLDRAAQLERVDAQVSYAGPVGSDELTRLSAIRGVAVAEATPSAETVVSHGTRNYATELEAFSANTDVQSFEAPDGREIALPPKGVLIPAALAGLLHARVGDPLAIDVTGSGLAPVQLPLAGLTTDTLGNLVFTRTSTIRAALGPNPGLAGGLFNTATLRFDAGADPAAIASTVQQLSGVAVYVPVGADLGTVSSARPVFAVLVDVFLGVGALVALLSIVAIVAAATPALSTSIRPGRLVRAVVLGIALGTVPGILLGRVVADRLVDSLESDLVHLVKTVDPTNVVIAVAVILAAGVATVLALAWVASRNRRRVTGPIADLRPYPAARVGRTVGS